MKRIFLHESMADNNNSNYFNEHARDNCTEPFLYLKKKLYSIGFEFLPYCGEELYKDDYVFFMNEASLSADNLYNKCIQAGNYKRLVLFLWEGPSVCNANYNNHYLYNKFKYIFTWNDDLVDEKKFLKFYLPITSDSLFKRNISFNNKKLLVNISMNKYSNYHKELYSLRRKAIQYFCNNYPKDFDLFGYGWNKPISRWQKVFPFLIKKYKCYKGKIDQKDKILPKYKFSLCFENVNGIKGLITEKIFDCLKCKVIPIYLGAENIQEYVDPNTFIDFRTFKNFKHLGNFIANMSEDEYNKYIFCIDQYLTSKSFKRFLPEKFSELIINKLKLN